MHFHHQCLHASQGYGKADLREIKNSVLGWYGGTYIPSIHYTHDPEFKYSIPEIYEHLSMKQ